MEASEELSRIEAEIDDAFGGNELAKLPFAQGVWTLLSVAEDFHFKNAVYAPLEVGQAAIFVDGLLNSLTHPLRVFYRRAPKGSYQFKRKLVGKHYTFAQDWLAQAEDYNHFCTIFPLYRAGQIELRVAGDELIPTDWSESDLSYEVYDRFVGKRDPEMEPILNPNLVTAELTTCMRVSGGVYSVNFTRRLVDNLVSAFGPSLEGRHMLPKDWTFSRFSLKQFRSVFTCLQAIALAWFLARQIAASKGSRAIAFASALWTPQKAMLTDMIIRQTGMDKLIVSDVLGYLTFGEVGVRNPDIAIQPIVDLTNGQFAISPFVINNVHAERNLCVLLNQIPSEQRLYSQLVEQKENEIRTETIASLSGLGFDFRHGQLTGTDVDLAIIDRKARTCLCIEIKWFIEPAEIREVIARSEELAKGVSQAQKIAKAFRENDVRLMTLLGIDQSYDFLTMVGSVNFIGGHRIQNPDVPITKLWHLAAEIVKRGQLSPVLEWLRTRNYLPRNEQDYKVKEIRIQSGRWRSRWYGIAYA